MKRGELDSRLLILVTLALVAFGLVMVYSATSASATVGGSDPIYYLKRQGIYAALGIILMIVAQRWDYRRLRLLSPVLVLASLGLLTAVLVIGPAINGARRWISLGPAVFQPSELAKVALAIWAAGYLARKPAPRNLRELWKPVGALAALFCLLLMLEPDMGTSIALLVMLSGMLVVAGTPARVLGAALTIACAAGTAAIWLEPYRRARFFAFLHPWHDAQGTGFQLVQAMISMGSGGIFGVGLGQSVGKIFYLPEAHTDMMLAVIGEELGLVGVTAVIAAYATFAYAGFNIAAVMGVAPLTGIPLPFLSYGGSSLVVLLVGVGILLNIAQHGNRAAVAVPDRRGGNGRTRATGTRRRGSAPGTRRTGDVRRVAGSRRSAAGS